MQKLEKIRTVVWGASGHASDVADALDLHEDYVLTGFIDDINPERRGEIFCDRVIMGGKEELPRLRHENTVNIALGFGHCSARIALGHFLRKEGFTLVNIYHPRSTVSVSAEIGSGTVILAGAIVGPQCQIGKYCIINKNSTISHGAVIGKGTHVCPGVSIGGGTSVGTGSWIGIGSCVIDKVTIGSGSFIGAGSVVVKDIPDGVLAYGNPARIIRSIDYSF